MTAFSFTSPRFHVVSVAVASVAGLSTFGTLHAMLPASAMFLGWVAYALGGPSVRGGCAHFVSFLFGLLFGIGTALAIRALTPGLGDAATPLAVSGVVILVLSLRTMAPFGNPLAYFLGLTSFFYSGFAPSAGTFAILAAAGAIGAASCAGAAWLEGRVTSGPHGRRPAAFTALS
ncbi:DUF1097 domain-containing protein [Gluconacetobacter takamatsuzukensis]|uniref:DUF1097 domain-containing protein n=1 Tax=Gluconacetobacter takamatsuzukensis TaxID=1286190 RepID=A0A7W4KFI8_9PROT|nr:DUF1097 domain-containing protein [Gluconacetobacter takamatsuzukensis]MBB2206022.1 DUF1097 domain-containing protein [Gluconacetobacter takamatsuzukensis]